MKIISLIIAIGFLASCLSVHKAKSNNSDTFDGPHVIDLDKDSLPKGVWFAYYVSDGVTIQNIGPLKVLVPKGWCFNKAHRSKKRFILEIDPNCVILFSKHNVHFTYWKEKKEEPFGEISESFIKKKKNVVVTPFNMGTFKGKSVRYEDDNNEYSLSIGLGENDALLISIIAPKGELTKMEQDLKLMLH